MSDLDPRAAHALLDDTERTTRDAVHPRTHLMFAAWGAAWFLGYLAIWISTRTQDPYRGPAGWAFVVLIVGLVAAAIVTALVVGRAAGGISGASSRTGTWYGITWGVAFATWGVIVGAIQDAGIPDGTSALLTGAVPALLIAVVYCASAASLEEPTMFYAGVALAALAAVGVWTGPATLPLVLALGGGATFAVATEVSRRSRR